MQRPGFLTNKGLQAKRRLPGKRPGFLQGWGLGDLDIQLLAPLRTGAYGMDAIRDSWLPAAIAQEASGARPAPARSSVQVGISQISDLAASLSSRSDAASATASILGAIASDAGIIRDSLAQGQDKCPAHYMNDNAGLSELWRRVQGNINLIVKSVPTAPSGVSAGAVTYLTVVDPGVSANNLAQLLGRLQTLKQKIGQIQPGGQWNPAEALTATSAQQVTPLQDELAGILNSFKDTPLTDTDKASFNTAAKEVSNFLAGKEVEANRAGQAFAKALSTVNSANCAGQTGNDLVTCCNNSGASGDDLAICLGTNLATDCFSKTGDELTACCEAARANGGAKAVEQCNQVSTTVKNLTSCSTFLPDFACDILGFMKDHWMIFAGVGAVATAGIGYVVFRKWAKVTTLGVLRKRKR